MSSSDLEKAASELAAHWQAEFSAVVAKAWSDEAFKDKLFDDTAATLEAEGIAILPNTTYRCFWVDSAKQPEIKIFIPREESGTDAEAAMSEGGEGSTSSCC